MEARAISSGYEIGTAVALLEPSWNNLDHGAGGIRVMSWEMHNIAAALAEKDIQLFVGPRPGKKSRDSLAALNLTHCCTLLSKREQVQPVRRICEELRCEWVWLPIEGGRLEVLRETDVVGHLETLLQSIEAEPNLRIYFHCSAGIHRTGFFVYLLLRLRGLSRDEAFAALSDLRSVTAEQVGSERLELADELVANAGIG